MKQELVKLKIPLPEDDPSGGEAEWLWALPLSEEPNTFLLRNVPTFVKGLSHKDTVRAQVIDGVPVFRDVVRRGGHSTYRIYAKGKRTDPEITSVLDKLQRLHCEWEAATDKIVDIDVLPDADIYAVYETLEGAEESGVLEFEEGHCGHQLAGGPSSQE